MIITAFDGNKIVQALSEQGIESAIIGKITEKETQIIQNGKIGILNQPKSDALYNVKFK